MKGSKEAPPKASKAAGAAPPPGGLRGAMDPKEGAGASFDDKSKRSTAAASDTLLVDAAWLHRHQWSNGRRSHSLTLGS